MTLYTNKVREFVRTRDWPRGLEFDVIEELVDGGAGLSSPQLRFQFYRDNWLQFEPHQHLKIASTIKEVMETLRADRIPCYMSAMANKREAEYE